MLRRIALFDRATRVDPTYAEAWANKGLNEALWASTWARDATEKDHGEVDAMKSIQRAVAIAPEMSQAYSALGILYHNQLMMKRALEVQSRSVELRSADSLTFFNYALSLAQARRLSEAESMIERAIDLDPLNPVAHQIKSTILFYGRRYAESIESARRALAIAPKNGRARTQIGWNLLLLGRADEAAREWQRVPPDDYRRLVGEATAAARRHREDVALRAIETIRKRYGDAANYQYAEIYAQLGRVHEGIAALEMAWRKRDSGLTSMLVDPFVDPLRSDARFGAVAERVFS
jgi:tetratricopeptide (TPR) repeat protein